MKYLALIVLTILVASCGSQPVKPANSAILQNVKVKADDVSMSGMFASVRGKKLKVGAFATPNQAAHHVAAGLVPMHIYVTLSGKQYNDVKAADFLLSDVELEPGVTYTIRPSVKGACIEMALVSDANEVIAGPIQRPWADFDSAERMLSVMSMEHYRAFNKGCE